MLRHPMRKALLLCNDSQTVARSVRGSRGRSDPGGADRRGKQAS
jgi:hypothetical protein